jgi:F0F1-type ATP synthase membrane subunit b/b'
MIRVKTFTSQLKIFHTRNELLELDQAVNDFVASQGIRKVISVSDAVTTGVKGEAIGIIRVITYEEPGEGAREKVLGKMEEKLKEWGGEIENLRGKADRLGAEARKKLQEQVEELRAKQESARQKLQEMRKTGGEAWEDLRTGAETALDDLRKAGERALGKRKK